MTPLVLLAGLSLVGVTVMTVALALWIFTRFDT